MGTDCTVTDIERSIVHRACGGDHRAFALLVEHNTPALRALAFRLLGDASSVDDALQETYAKAFRALPGFRGDSRFGTWLHRICQNVCTDELPRRRRAPSCIDDIDPSILATAGGEESVLDRDVLARALRTLSPTLRSTIVLVDAQGFDYADAAEALCVPRGTIKSRMARAKSALRHQLLAPPPSSAA